MEITARYRKSKVPMCVFGSASPWNTEAILLAAQQYASQHGIADFAVTVSMTFNYRHMPQSRRYFHCGDPISGFLANMELLKILAGRPGAPYGNVIVLPHLDHADPASCKWALNEGSRYLASAMFDAQMHSRRQNMELTREYVQAYGTRLVIEGIMDELAVSGHSSGTCADNVTDEEYTRLALEYVQNTGVDFIVADLGTEQQSESAHPIEYKKRRARMLSSALGDAGIVLHGISSMPAEQMIGLGEDGVCRINAWTRIAREAGRYAAEKVEERMGGIISGNFEESDSSRYFNDSIKKATGIMKEIMDKAGSSRLAAVASHS